MRLAVCGGKGGCGKTTTALALAGAFVGARRRPIVVDCDRDMPNLHVYADTPDAPGVDALSNGLPLDDVVHDASNMAGVRIVPGTPGCDVRVALDELELTSGTTPVLFDAPAGVSEDVALVLRAVDGCVLVSTPSARCLRATVKTAAMARALDAPPLAAVVSRARRVPRGFPEAVGVDPARIVAVPPLAEPVSSDACRALSRLCGRLRPNT